MAERLPLTVIADETHKDHPQLLETNIGSTCLMFLQILKARLEVAGYKVAYVAKTNRDPGKVIPRGFGQHQIAGLKGDVAYTCVGVSHDVLYVDDEQRDFIISGNYVDTPIFRDGKHVTARPTVGEPVPHEHWRDWNPPLPQELERHLPQVHDVWVPRPVEPARPGTNTAFRMPSYGELGDDAFFVEKVGAFVAEEMGEPTCRNCGSTDIAGGMNKGSATWIARTIHSILDAYLRNRDHREAEALALKHRNEMRAVLKRPPL
jgi:hypothetical protein